MARKRDTSAPPVGRCKAELQRQGVSNVTNSGVFKNYLGYTAVRVLEGDKYGEPYRFLCSRPKGTDYIHIKEIKIKMANMANKKRRKNTTKAYYPIIKKEIKKAAQLLKDRDWKVHEFYGKNSTVIAYPSKLPAPDPSRKNPSHPHPDPTRESSRKRGHPDPEQKDALWEEVKKRNGMMIRATHQSYRHMLMRGEDFFNVVEILTPMWMFDMEFDEMIENPEDFWEVLNDAIKEMESHRKNPAGATGAVGLLLLGLFGYAVGRRSVDQMKQISLNRRY